MAWPICKRPWNIGKTLDESSSNDTRSQRNLAVVYRELSRVKSSLGDRSAAREDSKKDLQITQKLADDDPHNAAVQLDLAQALGVAGDCYKDSNDFSSAKRVYEKALKIRLAHRDRRHAMAEWDLWTLMRSLAWDYVFSGDHSAAAQTCQKYLGLALELAQNNPLNTSFQLNVAISYWDLGMAKWPDLAAQRDPYQKSLEIFRKLLNDDPQNAEIKANIASVYTLLGQNLLNSGDLAAVRDLFREFSSMMPQSDEAHRGLGMALAKLAEKTGDNRQWDEAAAEILRAIELANDDPDGASRRKSAFFQLASWKEVFDRAVKLRPNEASLWIGRAEHFSALRAMARGGR